MYMTFFNFSPNDPHQSLPAHVISLLLTFTRISERFYKWLYKWFYLIEFVGRPTLPPFAHFESIFNYILGEIQI